MRITQRMPAFEGAAAGQTATCKLPIGRRFHHLFLEYSGVTLAQMTEIRVLANAKVIQRFSAAQRDSMNKFQGMPAAAGILQIPFDRWGLMNRAQEEVTALNTNVQDQNGNAVRSLTVEIDVSAGTPVLALYAEQSAPVPGGPGLILQIRKDTRSPAGAGTFDIADLPFNSPSFFALNMVHFIPSAGTISKGVIERDLVNMWERKTALNEFVQNNGVRVPQAGWWSIDRTESGYGDDTLELAGVKDYRYKLDVSGAMTITCISEYVGLLGD